MTLDRKKAARSLRRIAGLLEVRGDNIHRVRAFSNASRVVEKIDGDIAALIDNGQILEFKGIGKGTAAVLGELAAGETPEILAELENEIPPGVRDLMGVSGLGPKKIRALWRELGIESLGELEYACRENRLIELNGFGAKSQESVLSATRFARRSAESVLANEAHAYAADLVGALNGAASIERVLIAGEVRRWCETVGALELLVVADDASVLQQALEAELGECRPNGPGSWSGASPAGLAVEVSMVRAADAEAALLWSTGSDEHLETLKKLARDRGYDLRETGLWRDGQPVVTDSEPEIYEALDCSWIPPEMRELAEDVDRAGDGSLPDPVRLEELEGALHNHTTDSDGAASVEEMAIAAGKKGWSFFGVADHSPVAVYANGVDADRLRDQWRRIDEFNASGAGARVLKGLEADILNDGALDIPDGCEEGLEYVVASVHSAFRLSVDEQTQRLVRAVRHPACRILGHPTGRLLLARPGYEVDLEEVLQACADAGVAVEINASPYRLDLDWRWARRALELGLKLIVNPDAHSIDGLDDLRWGVAMARKAGATATDLVNCADIEEFIGGRDRQ